LNPQHILFLTNWYPTKENPSFGIFVKRHAESISENFSMTVVHLLFEQGKGILKISFIKSEIHTNTYTLKVSGRLFKLVYYMPQLVSRIVERKLRKQGLSAEFDLIISNVIFNSGIVGYFLSKRLNIKHFHIEHWSGVKNFIERNILRKKAKQAISNMASILVVSKQLENTIISIDASKKVHIVPNIISDYFKFSGSTRNIDKLVFLAVANWKYPKRLDLIIDGLTLFQEKNPNIDFDLRLIGQGPLLTESLLEGLKFSVERIKVIDNRDLPKIYNESDFLLHFSDFETFSIVPLEAMACGCPVIGSRVGILPDFINNSNGRIVDNDKNIISESITECVHSSFSRLDISNQINNLFSKDTIAAKFKQILLDT
jgi:glycosyltransferase involved in cell wall biosynthesis